MTNVKFVDFMGQEIHLGDQLVYPVRRGSTMVLKSAIVAEEPVKMTFTTLQGIVCLNDKGRRVVIRHSDRCVVVKSYEVKV